MTKERACLHFELSRDKKLVMLSRTVAVVTPLPLKN